MCESQIPDSTEEAAQKRVPAEHSKTPHKAVSPSSATPGVTSTQREKRFQIEETGMTLFMTDFLVKQDISVSADSLMEAEPGDVVTAYRSTEDGVETLHLKHWGEAEVPEDYVYG